MIVVAGESGLRVDELLHLEITKDLFFESKKLQTRFAKAMKGSGKRSRVTLFTPLARDTVRFYLKDHRPHIKGSSKTDYLFPSKSGELLCYSSAHSALREMIKIAQKNKLPIASHMSWHWARRIFATRFIERFPNQLSILLMLLGHVSPNTVHCYIRHSEAWTKKRIREMMEGDAWPLAGD
jgi:site-specific recombinase XerD